MKKGFIKKIKEYNFTTEQVQDMYKVLQKLSKNSKISIKEAIKLTKGVR